MSSITQKLHSFFLQKELISSSKKSGLDTFMLLGIGLFPLLYMTLRSWTNAFVFVLFLLALFYTLQNFQSIRSSLDGAASKWIVFTLCSPLLAIFISQAFRQEFSSTAFDGPSRILLTALIFLYLKDRQINFTKLIEWVIPISLIVCLAAYILNPRASLIWGGRAASYFVDTITFGTYCLILGFICLVSINFKQFNKHQILNILKIIGFLIGIYLAIKSQSRSAWTAGFGLFIFFSIMQYKKENSATLWLIMTIGFIFFISLYHISPNFHHRINNSIQETIGYFKHDNLDTSVGIRISMIRASFTLIMLNPLSGFKDGLLPNLGAIPSIADFYSDGLQFVMTKTGIHTEILAQGVRSGIWGLISSTALFFVPGWIFLARISHQNPGIRAAAIIGFTLVLGLFIASLTIQVFNLKYTSSFYALMIAALAAHALKKVK